jgi:hypothetical protein
MKLQNMQPSILTVALSSLSDILDTLEFYVWVMLQNASQYFFSKCQFLATVLLKGYLLIL